MQSRILSARQRCRAPARLGGVVHWAVRNQAQPRRSTRLRRQLQTAALCQVCGSAKVCNYESSRAAQGFLHAPQRVFRCGRMNHHQPRRVEESRQCKRTKALGGSRRGDPDNLGLSYRRAHRREGKAPGTAGFVHSPGRQFCENRLIFIFHLCSFRLEMGKINRERNLDPRHVP